MHKVEYWQKYFSLLGVADISPAWLENINLRLDDKLIIAEEPVVFAVPVVEHSGCDSSTSPNSVTARLVKVGSFKKGGFDDNYSSGNLALMDVSYSFKDGYVIATNRRFILVSSDCLLGLPYRDTKKVAVVENVATSHSVYIEFSAETMHAALHFPQAGLVTGLDSFIASEEGRQTPSQKIVASTNEAARQNAKYIREFLDDVVESASGRAI